MGFSIPKNKSKEGTFRARKKTHPHQNFLIFREIELFCSKTKKLLYFFLYFKRELVKSEKQKFLTFF